MLQGTEGRAGRAGDRMLNCVTRDVSFCIVFFFLYTGSWNSEPSSYLADNIPIGSQGGLVSTVSRV